MKNLVLVAFAFLSVFGFGLVVEAQAESQPSAQASIGLPAASDLANSRRGRDAGRDDEEKEEDFRLRPPSPLEVPQ